MGLGVVVNEIIASVTENGTVQQIETDRVAGVLLRMGKSVRIYVAAAQNGTTVQTHPIVGGQRAFCVVENKILFEAVQMLT